MRYLTQDSIAKISRIVITAGIFLTTTFMYKWGMREAQTAYFAVGIMALIGLYLNNLWLSIFLWWSLLLFGLSHFTMGQGYISNIFLGCILYMICKKSFKKEHIDWYINCFLGFIALNIMYSALQVFNYDFLFSLTLDNNFVDNNNPTGFFAYRAAYGMAIALSIPLIMTRSWKYAPLYAILMFIPLYLSSSSVSIVAGFIGFIYALYHTRKYWRNGLIKYRSYIISAIIAVSIVGSTYYALKADDPDTSINVRTDMWKMALRDSIIHPITGWGLDSFRNVNKIKPFSYVINAKMVEGHMTVDYFDNPHNLFVSLVYEWGWTILIPIYFWIRDFSRRFRRSEKMPNVIALSGLFIVLAVLSVGQFPFFLARFMIFIIPLYAMYEVETEEV